ncbi:MAG: hypothetical protein PHS02_00915 [Candidatus ainarchaeum sp.]|nr:hypothetical protein [Candidatus ainarchaeum sp.]
MLLKSAKPTIPGLIGADRSNDRRFKRYELIGRDHTGKEVECQFYGEKGKRFSNEIVRAINESKAGKATVGDGYVKEVDLLGLRIGYIQFYTRRKGEVEYGLPMTLVNGKAYFPGGDEIILTEELESVRMQDDRHLKKLDLPTQIRFGGGLCPTVQQKALDLNVEFWISATAELLGGLNELGESRAGMTDQQLIGAYVDIVGAMQQYTLPGFLERNVCQLDQTAKSQSFAADRKKEVYGGENYGEEPEDARFLRYNRAVRMLNAKLRRNLHASLTGQSNEACVEAEKGGKPSEATKVVREAEYCVPMLVYSNTKLKKEAMPIGQQECKSETVEPKARGTDFVYDEGCPVMKIKDARKLDSKHPEREMEVDCRPQPKAGKLAYSAGKRKTRECKESGQLKPYGKMKKERTDRAGIWKKEGKKTGKMGRFQNVQRGFSPRENSTNRKARHAVLKEPPVKKDSRGQLRDSKKRRARRDFQSEPAPLD